MGVRIYGGLCFLFALLPFAAEAASPIVLKIPCDSAPWPSCVSLQSQLVGGVANGTFPGGMNAIIRQGLDDAYNMQVRLAPNLVGQAQCTTFDNLNEPPLCPPIPIPQNGCVDESTKAFEAPSGVSQNCPAISLVGAASGTQPLFSLTTTNTGSLETANVGGGLPLAISNTGLEITGEVQKNALTVSSTSPCYAKAQSLQSLIASQNSVQLLQEINACDPTDTTQNCSAKQYFNGTLNTILSAYIQVASCRLSNESSTAFIAFTMDPGSPAMIPYTQILYNLFLQQCFYSNAGNPAAMRSCYARSYQSWVLNRAKTDFPLVAAACAGGPNPSLLIPPNPTPSSTP